MKLAPSSAEAFNVIVVGAWNPAIFSPEWAKEHLAQDKMLDVILAIPMMPLANMPPRLTVEGVNLYPSETALMLDCAEYNNASIEMCASKFQKVANLLPHTPVNAVGINFRFLGDLDDSEVLADLFTFSDAGKIDSTQFGLSGTLIKRTFKLPDSTALNLSLDTSLGNLNVEFNFHTDIRRISEAVAKTSAEQICMARDKAVQFLRDVYNIELET